MNDACSPYIPATTITAPDGTVLAYPLGLDEAIAMGVDPGGKSFAPIVVAGRSTSTFDVAWHCAAHREFPPWSAVIALTQVSGRGQLRREWVSPPGNLYVSFFLPEDLADMGALASLATGYCIHAALAAMGIRTLLKWPNDLLLQGPHGEEGKFGGLLLEERGGCLLAGLGLNLRSAPEDKGMREGRAVPAAALESYAGTVFGMWLELVSHMRTVYARDIKGAPRDAVREKTERALAWKGRRVRVEDTGATGDLVGVDHDGSLLVQTLSGLIVVSCGSVVPF